MTDEDAFLAAIEANLSDTLVRGVFADWLDEAGRHDEAAAWRATADRVPWQTVLSKGRERWSWRQSPTNSYLPPAVPPTCFVPQKLWGDLSGGSVVAFVYRDYPIPQLALLDLIAAWVAVEAEKAAVCDWCEGKGEERVADAAGDMDDIECRRCAGTGRAIPAEAQR